MNFKHLFGCYSWVTFFGTVLLHFSKEPNGGGEQNMLNFVSNIVVLDYLTAINRSDPETTSKAITFLETGYQGQLRYKHDNGSYSEWGKSDKSGSTWLTALVAKSFHQASKYIFVDPHIIKNALDFLSQTQSEDGSFVENGHIIHEDLQDGSSSGAALTAYVLITFLENENFNEAYRATIDKALRFLSENCNTTTDNYSLAIVAYALQLADHSLKDTLLSKLETKAVKQDNGMRWGTEVSESERNFFKKASALDIEMTAYALQAFLTADRLTNATQILKWLISQRNENGGFHSTQDTVVGLQALSKVAAKMYSANTNMTIRFHNYNGYDKSVSIDGTNAFILQKDQVPSPTTNLHITAKGHGVSIFQISYQYNILTCPNTTDNFNITKTVPNLDKNTFRLDVCTNYTSVKRKLKSKTLLMDVHYLSGYSITKDSLKKLKSKKRVQVRKVFQVTLCSTKKI